MSQGLLADEVEGMARADALTARAGLPLVLEALRALGLDQAIGEHVQLRARASGYGETAKVEALVRLLAAGGECLDDIQTWQADAGLARRLGRPLPSADTLRHFLYAFHTEGLITAAQAKRPPGKEAYIPAESPALQGLGRVNQSLVQRVAAQGKGTRATLDHDATSLERHKREALPHYQGGRGYQPAAIYWVEQDLVVADEVPRRQRPGRHGQPPAHPAGLRKPARHRDGGFFPRRQRRLRRARVEVVGPPAAAGWPPGADRLHDQRRHDRPAAGPLRGRTRGDLAALRGAGRRDRLVHGGGVHARRLAQGRVAAALPRPAAPEEAGRAVWDGRRHEGPWPSPRTARGPGRI